MTSRRAALLTIVGERATVRPLWLASIASVPALYWFPLSSAPLLGWRIIPLHRSIDVAGVCLVAGGLAFSVWARRSLAANWSGAVVLKRNHSLITSGPYRVVRHPIYLGVLCAMLGTALVIGEIRACLPLLGACLVLRRKIAAEEALLVSAYPADYASYSREVRHPLLPPLPGL